jgi:(S)-3,5-dihydroxyphenylglycine transaminase
MAADPMASRELTLGDLHGSLADPLLDAMTFLNEITSRFPGAISFAPGRPNEELFSHERIPEYLDAYIGYLQNVCGFSQAQVRSALFQYGRTKGQIHDLIAATLANDEGIHVDPDAVVITVGAQEGMLLVLRALFAGPRDVLLVSSPCYVGITGAARLLDIEVVPVEEGACGPDAQAVGAAVARVRAAGKRPRAFYAVPDCANPSGISMPLAARHKLLEVAGREELLIIEDNPYGFFTMQPEPGATLKSLDRDATVIYLGSFAKTCFPGARLGYVLADQRVITANGSRGLLADELAKIKSMTTINTPSLSQAVIGGMLVMHNCHLRAANSAAIGFYRANITTLLGELERHFPAPRRRQLGVHWNTPGGGFFVVVTVPFLADEKALERSASQHGVLWTPMACFYLGGGGGHQLRLSCSYITRAQVVDGAARLARFIGSAASG